MSNRRGILGLVLIFLIFAGDLITGIASTHIAVSDPQVPLGQWKNFPLASQCSTGNYTAPVCELIGNTTYRGAVLFAAANQEAGFKVQLNIGCTIPSNTLGAFIQLQYANYSGVTRMNVSNFVNIGAIVKIDNSANWPCPGTLIGGAPAILPAAQTGFIFRAVGSAGGGPGDNPRFSSVTAIFQQSVVGAEGANAVSITTTGFSARPFVTYPLTTATTLNFRWIATNITSALTSCVEIGACIQHGSGSCSAVVQAFLCISAVTFPIAFSTTPDVVVSGTNAAVVSTAPIGGVNLLLAQTLTV